jgi:HlyD family secretion protein
MDSRRTGAALAALVGCAFFTACGKSADNAPTPLVTVQAERPKLGTIAEHIAADAVLTPLAQAAIAPKISAPVRRFFVQRGSHVRAGQLLATLENRDLTAAAMDNRGSYAAAQAAYATATQAQVPEEYQRAELDVAQAKANLALSQSIVNARKQLFAEGAIPGRDLDTAQAALVQAQAAYDTAVKHLEAQKSVARQASLEAAKGQLASAEGKYQGAEAQVSYSEIRSPIPGVVTERPLFAGETVAAGSTLLTVMDTSVVLAKVHLAQELAQQLKLGDGATITVPGLAEPVLAKVSLISPALDPGSTTVEIWLRIDNKKGELKVGTPVHASIVGSEARQALTVPLSALLTAQDGSKSVMVVASDGTARNKPVSVGITDAGRVQVTNGLTASDMVIGSGNYALEDGTKVTVGAASDAEDANKPGAAKVDK